VLNDLPIAYRLVWKLAEKEGFFKPLAYQTVTEQVF
jgi:hypothetical protein